MARQTVKRHSSHDRRRANARSVRFTQEENRRLEQAAEAAGLVPSEFIRQAVSHQCDEILAPKPAILTQIADLIGAIDVPVTLSEQTGKTFTDHLVERHNKQRRLT